MRLMLQTLASDAQRWLSKVNRRKLLARLTKGRAQWRRIGLFRFRLVRLHELVVQILHSWSVKSQQTVLPRFPTLPSLSFRFCNWLSLITR